MPLKSIFYLLYPTYNLDIR